MSVCALFFSLAFKLSPNIYASKFTSDAAVAYKSECLYKKINDFLLEYKDVPPEKFDDICKEYMTKNTTTVKLLSEKDFEEKSKDSIVLYRGINENQFADNFKKGIIYMPSNAKNVRGMGIYTTTSLECAKRYSDKTDRYKSFGRRIFRKAKGNNSPYTSRRFWNVFRRQQRKLHIRFGIRAFKRKTW